MYKKLWSSKKEYVEALVSEIKMLKEYQEFKGIESGKLLYCEKELINEINDDHEAALSIDVELSVKRSLKGLQFN